MEPSTCAASPERWGVVLAVVVALTVPRAAEAARPGSGPTVWVAPATQKVRPGDKAGSLASASISAARNEFEAFQIVVTGTARGVSAAVTGELTFVDPVTATKAVIGDVRLYREAIINLQRASSSDPESATGPWPDALVPAVDEFDAQQRNAFPFDVRGASQAIWVEVFVPKDAPAGDYHGVVTVSVGGKAFQTVGVTLRVWDFELPSTASARSAFALAYGALPTGFGFSASDQAAFSELRRRFGVLALDHRISLSRHDDGIWFDLDHFASVYGPLMDGTAAESRLRGARLTAVEYLGPPSGSDLGQDTRRWADFFSRRTVQEGGVAVPWSERLFQYTADEPNDAFNTRWLDVPARAAAAHGATPPIRSLVTTTLPEARVHAGTVGGTLAADHVIDIMVPAVNFMDETRRHADFGTSSDPCSYDTFLLDPSIAPGNQLWMYQSCMSHDCGGSSSGGTGWPSYMIDASAVRNRAMQWLLFAYETTGELYWETGYALYAKRDAWTDQWAFTGNGDGTLFYPGRPAKIGGTTNVPVASIRLKMIREGMEDFEYLTLLAGFGETARQDALALARGLFPAPDRTGDVTPQALADQRASIACHILSRLNKACPPTLP